MMVVIDLFVLGGWRYIWPQRDQPYDMHEEQYRTQLVEGIEEANDEVSFILPDRVPEPIAESEPAEKIPRWKANAVPFVKPDWAKGVVVIIIDDLGVDKRRETQTVDLPAPLTLAYLPYAKGLHAMTRHARSQGHELLIHTPMEPMSDKANPGPGALMDDMSAKQIAKNLDVVLKSFDGYIGINNHMGSKITQNEPIMAQVMGVLAKHELAFVDSVTTKDSVAGQEARKAGLATARRDVFLDHEETPEFVHGALARLEKLALRDGAAIAIGHPKDVTIEALAEWIPTLRDKGLVLAPVSAVLE